MRSYPLRYYSSLLHTGLCLPTMSCRDCEFIVYLGRNVFFLGLFTSGRPYLSQRFRINMYVPLDPDISPSRACSRGGLLTQC